MSSSSEVQPAAATFSPQQWKSHLLEAQNLHKHAKIYLISFIAATVLVDVMVILTGGNYLNLEQNTKVIYGTVTVSTAVKCGSTVLPKIRSWILNKINAEAKELDALNDPVAKEIEGDLTKVTLLATTDNQSFKNQIQSLWPLVAAVAAGGLSSPYNYLSSAIAGLGTLGYIANNWYQIIKTAHMADALFSKLEAEHPAEV